MEQDTYTSSDNSIVYRKDGPVGVGTFSVVTRAKMRLIDSKEDLEERVALKIVHRNSDPKRILNEIRRLSELGGSNNVIELLDTLRLKDTFVFVLPLYKFDHFREIIKRADARAIARYMRELFVALNHLHKHNVMHRDVKPGNFLFSMDTSRGVLIDFGLAEDDRSKVVRDALSTVPARRRKKRKRVITNIVDDTTMSTTGSFTAASQRLSNLQSSAVHFSMHRSIVSSAATSRKRPFSRHLIQVSGATTTAASRVKSDRTQTTMKGKRKRIHDSSLKSNKNKLRCRSCDNVKCPGEASRAGTPGFRAPEVLAKSILQSTKIDMWSAGVIFASLLTRRYPFFPFRSENDVVALCEILVALRSEKDTIQDLNDSFSDFHKHIELLHFDEFLAHEKPLEKGNRGGEGMCISSIVRLARPNTPDEAIDLLLKCLRISPEKRISAEDALKHPFICKFS